MPFISSGLNVGLLLHCVVVYQGTSLPSTPTSDGQPGSRKRRWGSSSSKKKTSLSISTDSLKVKTFYNNRDFKIRDYRRLDARSPMSGGLERVRSVVACCGAKTQIKLLHYQLRTTRNCSSRIHFEDVFPKSQR